jgi:hypothetical protein
MTHIDFFATQSHYVDHMAPIWKELGSTGFFFVPSNLEKHMSKLWIQPFLLAGADAYRVFKEDTPILVASYADLQTVYLTNRHKPIIYMEHGVGIVYPGSNYYAGNVGMRRFPVLTLAPNEIVHRLTAKAIPGMKQAIIGTPKLDQFASSPASSHTIPRNAVVCMSFHWDGKQVSPEAGTSWPYYKGIIPELHKRLKQERDINLILHGHPRIQDEIRTFAETHNVQFIADFEEIMKTAQLYICDNSSTIYEFLVTGYPVILLNNPAYRRNIDFGIRFWQYTDIGTQVDVPSQLFIETIMALDYADKYRYARKKAVEYLFPHLGSSTAVAIDAIHQHFQK